jgi:hypothetical protein
MATAPDEVNEDLLDEIVNQVKYSIESPLQIARVATRKHPAFRAAAKLANKADREQQNKTIRSTVTDAVDLFLMIDAPNAEKRYEQDDVLCVILRRG